MTMTNLLFLLLATVSAVYLGFNFSRGRQKRISVPFVVVLVLVIGYGGWQASRDSSDRFESSDTPSGQIGENAKQQLSVPEDLNLADPGDIPADNSINPIVTKPPSVPKDLDAADSNDIPIAIKRLSVPTGINPASPGDIPSDNLINTGDLLAFLQSVSLDGRTQILNDARLWAEIWTFNNTAMRFSSNDVISLLNQLPEPSRLDEVEALVANAVLASKN